MKIFCLWPVYDFHGIFRGELSIDEEFPRNDLLLTSATG